MTRERSPLINDLAMLRQRELLAESNKRRRVLPALRQVQAQQQLRRAIRQFLKLDGDARQLTNELPTLIHKAEEQPAGGTCTCRSCMPSR